MGRGIEKVIKELNLVSNVTGAKQLICRTENGEGVFDNNSSMYY